MVVKIEEVYVGALRMREGRIEINGDKTHCYKNWNSFYKLKGIFYMNTKTFVLFKMFHTKRKEETKHIKMESWRLGTGSNKNFFGTN